MDEELRDFCIQWSKETEERVRRELRKEQEAKEKEAAAKILRDGYPVERIARWLHLKIETVEQVRASLSI